MDSTLKKAIANSSVPDDGRLLWLYRVGKVLMVMYRHPISKLCIGQTLLTEREEMLVKMAIKEGRRREREGEKSA